MNPPKIGQKNLQLRSNTGTSLYQKRQHPRRTSHMNVYSFFGFNDHCYLPFSNVVNIFSQKMGFLKFELGKIVGAESLLMHPEKIQKDTT
mgnify:CR=1 FL=1